MLSGMLQNVDAVSICERTDDSGASMRRVVSERRGSEPGVCCSIGENLVSARIDKQRRVDDDAQRKRLFACVVNAAATTAVAVDVVVVVEDNILSARKQIISFFEAKVFHCEFVADEDDDDDDDEDEVESLFKA